MYNETQQQLNGSIRGLTPASKTVVHRYPLPSGIYDAYSVAFDTAGNLWIAARHPGKIVVMGPSGQIIRVWHLDSVASIPVSVAQALNHIYVAEQPGSFVYEMTLEGYSGFWISAGCLPTSIAPGKYRDLWVAGSACNSIFHATLDSPPTIQEYHNMESADGIPERLTVDPNGNVWYSDAYKNIIYKVTFSLGLYR